MHVYVKDASYLGNYIFEIEFNVGKRVVDIRNVHKLDSRHKFVNDEKIVSKMKCEGPSLGYKEYDIAPEILYEASQLQ